MTLAGTRPILQEELRQYELHHRARIAIKPGITGMWQKYGYSARVIHKLLRLARTSADLDGEEKIRQKDIEKVLTCRELDKSNSKMVVVK